MGKKSKSKKPKPKEKQPKTTKPAQQAGKPTRPLPKLLRIESPATAASDGGNASSAYNPHEFQQPYPADVRKPAGWLRINVTGAKQVSYYATMHAN